MGNYDAVLWDKAVFSLFAESEKIKLGRLINDLWLPAHAMFELRTLHPEKLDFSINIKSPKSVKIPLNPFCRQLLDQWATDENYAAFIQDAWLEFDSVNDTYSHSLFFTIRNFNHLAPHVVSDFLVKSIPRPEQRAMVEKVLQRIPPENIVSHLGFMHNRENSPVRINIKQAKNNFDELTNLLGIDPGNWPEVVPLLEIADSLTLTLDIYETGIGARIGLECFFDNQQADYHLQKQMMEKLVKAGYSAPGIPGIVSDWTGVSGTGAIHGDAHGILTRLKPAYFWRILNHVKLVAEPGKIETKIYLAYGHKWANE